MSCAADYHTIQIVDKMEALHGFVEIDETCIGGKETHRHASKKLTPGKGGAVGTQPT